VHAPISSHSRDGPRAQTQAEAEFLAAQGHSRPLCSSALITEEHLPNRAMRHAIVRHAGSELCAAAWGGCPWHARSEAISDVSGELVRHAWRDHHTSRLPPIQSDVRVPFFNQYQGGP